MKKLMTATLLGSLILASCGGDSEEDQEETETTEETTEENTDNNGDETVEESTDDGEDDTASDTDTDEDSGTDTDSDSDTESDTDSEGAEDDDSSGLGGLSDDADEDLDTEDLEEEEIDIDDLDNSAEGDIVEGDYSVTFLINSNDELIDVINSSEETDLSVDDVLMPGEDVTTYTSQTYLGVFGFIENQSEPQFADMIGVNGMVDESDGLQVYVEQYNDMTGQYEEHGYGDSVQDELYLYENGEWNDYSGMAEPEEIMYGLYMNIEPILRDLSDTIEVRETDDYYVLYSLGLDDGIHDTLGELFAVEFTNANMDELVSGVFGIVNKDTDELEHLSYISHAPGLNPEEFLQIDLALDFLDYGGHEDGVLKPDGIDTP